MPAYEPEFTGETVTPSSADPTYHPVAIQLYGHANKFNASTTNHVRFLLCLPKTGQQVVLLVKPFGHAPEHAFSSLSVWSEQCNC